MKAGMPLEALLNEVIRQNAAKRDFVTSTKNNVRMVEADDLPRKTAVVLLKEGASELERFAITDNAHEQIAARLEIPRKYYFRLLDDHRDLVLHQVNALFEREPSTRLFRVLDGKLRAFLSDRYLRLDNKEVLEQTLPAIVKGEIKTQMLSSNISENSMDLKVVFTDPRLEQEITRKTRTGQPRIVKPGFHMRNSETGNGSLSIQGFFYDSYCLNGCVYNKVEGFEFRRSHLGGRLIEGANYEVISEESRRLEDATIISQVRDVMRAMANPEFAQKMGDVLRAAANTPPAKSPMAAVDLAVKELPILESEKESILTTFLQDGDFSQWGLASAVTAVANRDDVTYERATELENIGGQILSMQLRDWKRFAEAEKVAA